ncbi:MAG TPA: hypothetical protein VGO93_20675 [Candidatus Xenobia bacterium]|jgi:hypothetical protein
MELHDLSPGCHPTVLVMEADGKMVAADEQIAPLVQALIAKGYDPAHACQGGTCREARCRAEHKHEAFISFIDYPEALRFFQAVRGYLETHLDWYSKVIIRLTIGDFPEEVHLDTIEPKDQREFFKVLAAHMESQPHL